MTQTLNEFGQLGKFIYQFQSVERQIEDMISLLVNADDEMIETLVTGLSFNHMVKSLDIIFARFARIRSIDETEVENFHLLMNRVAKLAERRNEIVHSKYWSLLTADGEIGLLRRKSRLRPSMGELTEEEEEIMCRDFQVDIERSYIQWPWT